jgi:TonB-linked SusC/RagA family outer membrane protein
MIYSRHGKLLLPYRRKNILVCLALAINVLSIIPAFSQSAQEPKISLVATNMSLAEVFAEITKQTGLQVVYNGGLLDDKVRVNLLFTAQPLQTVLQTLLQGKDLQFDITGRYIAIFAGQQLADNGNKTSLAVSQQPRRDTPANSPAPGSRVLDEVIVTGFQRIEKKKFTGSAVQLNAEDVKINGMMDVSRMLEGRVAGVSVQNVSGTFGTAPKVRIRGVASISGENKPLWVVDDVVLEDVVNITNDQLSSGDANTLLGSSVAGLNADDIESFTILKDASATALYGARAMNGVIVITTKKGRVGKPVISYTGNFTTQLKPSYDHFNLLNSADQMSVYSEMMRKGWLNSTDLATRSNTGVFGKMYNLINTYDSTAGQYGLANTPEARTAFLLRYAKTNTDWFDVLFKNSLAQEHAVNISSGNDLAQYYFSGSMYNDNGWAMGNNVKRYTANMRVNYKLSDKLTVGFISTGSIREQTAPGTNSRVSNVVSGSYDRTFDINPYSYALNTSRTLTAYDEKGDVEYFTRNFAPFNIIQELSNNSIRMNVLDFKLQGELNYKIIPNLQFTANAAMRYVKTSREQQVTEYSNAAEAYRASYNMLIRDANQFLYKDPDDPNAIPEIVLPKGGFYNRYENSLKNFNIRNQLTYNKTIAGYHAVKLLAGQEIKFADRQDAFNNGFGFQYERGGTPFVDYRLFKQMLEQDKMYYGMQMSYDRFAAFFGNMNYAYDNRYILNATLRYDGTNKLGGSRNARWLPTWTIGAAWIVNPAVKLRASYGLTASMGDATNSTVLLSNGTTRRPLLSEKESQIDIIGLENSELTWEKQYTANLGADANLLKDKVTVSVDLYNKRSFDLISALKTSGVGGQGYKVANYADMKSHGIEVAVSSRQVQDKYWSWSSNFTLGYNKGRITRLTNVPRLYDLVIPEGGALYDHPARGLYSVVFTSLNPENGMPQFLNEKGESSPDVYLQSNAVSYLKYEGPVDPTFTGGLSNTVRYRSWELSFLITYQAGNKVRLTPQFKASYSDVDAMPYEFLNRWTLPGDEKYTNVPSILSQYETRALSSSYPYNNYNYSTARVADGSFARVKTISLTYRLAPGLTKAMGMSNLSFSVIGTNLWLLYADKKLQGQDPEFFTSGGVALPMPRQFTASLKIGL